MIGPAVERAKIVAAEIIIDVLQPTEKISGECVLDADADRKTDKSCVDTSGGRSTRGDTLLKIKASECDTAGGEEQPVA
jgi:hypothetical protein